MLQLGDRNRQLCADNESMRAQLERFAAAVQQGEEEHGRLEQAAGELRREGQRLQERAQEAEAEARQLAKLADSLQGAKTSLEGQLAEAQGEASAAAAARQAATAAADALRQERDGLAATVQQLQEGNVGLESAVARLRGQLQQSNGVLDSCRQMLGECCSARWVGMGAVACLMSAAGLSFSGQPLSLLAGANAPQPASRPTCPSVLAAAPPPTTRRYPSASCCARSRPTSCSRRLPSRR